jgi:hypothetical protein
MKKLLTITIIISSVFTASAKLVTQDIFIDGFAYNGSGWAAFNPGSIVEVQLKEHHNLNLDPFNYGDNVTVDLGNYLQDFYTPPDTFIDFTQITDPLGDGFSILFHRTWVFVPVPDDRIICSFSFEIPDHDSFPLATVNITWSGTYGYDDLSQFNETIHRIVPEPTGITILGLGGLLIRRRNRK